MRCARSRPLRLPAAPSLPRSGLRRLGKLGKRKTWLGLAWHGSRPSELKDPALPLPLPVRRCPHFLFPAPPPPAMPTACKTGRVLCKPPTPPHLLLINHRPKQSPGACPSSILLPPSPGSAHRAGCRWWTVYFTNHPCWYNMAPAPSKLLLLGLVFHTSTVDAAATTAVALSSAAQFILFLCVRSPGSAAVLYLPSLPTPFCMHLPLRAAPHGTVPHHNSSLLLHCSQLTRYLQDSAVSPPQAAYTLRSSCCNFE